MIADQVRVQVAVPAPPDVAFAVFTEETDLWWKRGPAYRVAGRRPGTLRFEAGAGGRLYEAFETAAGERVHVAGTVLVWDPPNRLVFEWKAVNFEDHQRTEVEVVFEPTARGTRVTLVHRGFASLPDGHPAFHGKARRAAVADFGRGWGSLLTSLRRHAAG